MNVFWFHQTLDVVDPTDSYTVAALAGTGDLAVGGQLGVAPWVTA
ncbi:hypothetical protein [Halorubrum sp. CGM4_25_10-8A]|nr:hypothetical protein [Halorubrum sp. CGM4_25_10-8A]